MGYGQNEHGKTDHGPATKRNAPGTAELYSVDPDRATKMVNIHLENDSTNVDYWRGRAEEIRAGIREGDAAGRIGETNAELLAEGVMTERDAVRLKLAELIREHVETTFRRIKAVGVIDVRHDSPLPGLMSTIHERYLSAVRWDDVAENLMPEK